jgi:hypothetical protein
MRSECASSMTLTNHITPASPPGHLIAESWGIVRLEWKKKGQIDFTLSKNILTPKPTVRVQALEMFCYCKVMYLQISIVWGVAFSNRNGAWSRKLSCFSVLQFLSEFQSQSSFVIHHACAVFFLFYFCEEIHRFITSFTLQLCIFQ